MLKCPCPCTFKSSRNPEIVVFDSHPLFSRVAQRLERRAQEKMDLSVHKCKSIQVSIQVSTVWLVLSIYTYVWLTCLSLIYV